MIVGGALLRKVLFATLCLLLFIVNIDVVNASSCDSADIERLKVLASNVTYNSDYIGDTDMTVSTQTYNVNFIGITDELYVSNVYGGMRVDSDSQVIQLQSGTTTLEVYSRNCDDKRLKTITIELPKYNEYSLLEECDNISDDDLYVCDPWYQGKITDDSFEEVINNYNLELEESNKTTLDKVYEIFKDYYYIIIPVILILIVLIIVLFIRKHKKSSLD